MRHRTKTSRSIRDTKISSMRMRPLCWWKKTTTQQKLLSRTEMIITPTAANQPLMTKIYHWNLTAKELTESSVASIPNVSSTLSQQKSVEEDEKASTSGDTISKANDLESRAGSIDEFGSFDISDDLVVSAGTVKISTSTSASSKLGEPEVATSVTPRRKEELLLEARNERLKWVQQVPLPFEKPVDANTSSFLRYTHVSQHLPTASKILQHLYGHAEPADRIESVLGRESEETDKQQQRQHIYLTGNQILAAELEAATSDDDTKALLKSYQTFLNHLQDPACGLLVQGMRNFCRSFRDIPETAIACAKLKAYAAETFKTIQQHAVFFAQEGHENNNNKDQLVLQRRSFESFLFGHCRSHLEELYWQQPGAAARARDQSFQERLQTLQFVTPAHLEIACLANNNMNDSSLPELLAESIAALQAVDSYHSVYEKLQQILAIYRGANTALTAALNRDGGGDDDKNKKLPSADDVLPTIILTVLIARPARLHYNLQLVEDLSPAEYLRGEAGYAFTNLFGAVQFLEDLDLSNEPASLSITKEALQEGMAASKAAVEERLQLQTALDDHVESILPPEGALPSLVVDKDNVAVPPLSEIRKARLRGEKVDVEWALQWQEQNNAAGNNSAVSAEAASVAQEEERLPPGFRRQYSFLTKRPEDIRVSDLPLLLEEYRMLVRTTETLLGERTLKATAARKAKTRAMEKELLSAVSLVDPSLLPERDSESESKSKKT